MTGVFAATNGIDCSLLIKLLASLPADRR